jgi:hypothetical protein
MKRRRQRRTLAARGQIATAEIGDRGNPGQLRNDVRIAKLQGVRHRANRAMADGLPMRSECGHI